MSFVVNKNNLVEAGFRQSASRSAPRSAPMRRPVLAGSVVNNILKNPNLWGQVAPSALESHFATYKNAIGHPNQRTKYLNKLGINKLKISRSNLLRGMRNHERNMTSVYMRLHGYKHDPIKLKEAIDLLQKEKRGLKHASLLPLAGAIKQAKSAMNANRQATAMNVKIFNLYTPNERINFSPNKVNRLKREKLLVGHLTNEEIDEIVNAIRLKIPKK